MRRFDDFFQIDTDALGDAPAPRGALDVLGTREQRTEVVGWRRGAADFGGMLHAGGHALLGVAAVVESTDPADQSFRPPIPIGRRFLQGFSVEFRRSVVAGS